MIGESTVGPRLDKVDLDSSSIIVSLPVGRWKLQFQKFEFPTKLSKDILGATDYFDVVRGKPQTLAPVEIKLKGAKMTDL